METPNYFRELCEELNDWCDKDVDNRTALVIVSDSETATGVIKGYDQVLAESIAQFFVNQSVGQRILPMVLLRLKELQDAKHDL